MHNPFEKLKDVQFSHQETQSSKQERVSKKPIDIAVRKILEHSPELKENIVRVMGKLSSSRELLPLIHITTDKIVLPDGSERNSTMVEQIKKQGFQGRHTNVGAFVVRAEKARLALPQDYEKNPEDFLQSLIILLRRYWHHGSRTNKDIYAEKRDQGKGIPIMLVLEGNIPIEKGTDYDDHYILKENAPSRIILGTVELGSESGVNVNMILKAAENLLQIISAHTNTKELKATP